MTGLRLPPNRRPAEQLSRIHLRWRWRQHTRVDGDDADDARNLRVPSLPELHIHASGHESGRHCRARTSNHQLALSGGCASGRRRVHADGQRQRVHGGIGGAVERIRSGHDIHERQSAARLDTGLGSGDNRHSPVAVFVPTSGALSPASPFAISPAPQLTLSATQVTAGTAVTMTLAGGFGGSTDWLALASTTAPNNSYLHTPTLAPE